ncbi:transposase [Sorangium cellulosum]|uniref:Transposase n=1 Tax=Sorangium cellulosum TaxID=56 RepID=A0A150RD64_SORCE|nr:transposase [Sorangium cellulosum]
MDVHHERCAGLDVHKDTVVACARVLVDGKVERSLRTFGTTTRELLSLADWIEELGCTHVAMEATGVYWKPIWHVLEGRFALILGNARHLRNVPGRKTDVNDATWIAELLAHGLIRGSFVPPTPTQELRDLTRTRKQLVREMTQHTQRIQKTLEDANIKLSSVVSDTLGASGRAILDAIVAGETDPEQLAQRATSRLKASRAELAEALRGHVTDHHRFLLGMHLRVYDDLQRAVRDVEARIERELAPFRDQIERLKTIPGINDVAAQVIAAEIGLDMNRFPTENHLKSWAGLCPRNDTSAGKRKSTRLRDGAPWLKTTLVQAAWSAATRTKGTYYRAQYHRIRARRGHKKAVMAVAASMLTAAYHILRNGTTYQELGSTYFDKRDAGRVANRLLRRLADLGFQVEVKAAA